MTDKPSRKQPLGRIMGKPYPFIIAGIVLVRILSAFPESLSLQLTDILESLAKPFVRRT
ncbi:MAG: hypothetical protein JSV58_00245 [Candidatus Bathyarchaeota archaeon]|nr:MAG: hypothetical protein JSV58_00245 [Candidatus Bathyarchaeota archaeon]